MRDLLSEFAALHDPLETERGRARLASLGLDVILARWRGPAMVMAARIRVDGAFFDYDPDGGDPALILANWDRPRPFDDGLTGIGEDLHDLIAFDPARPERWSFRLGVPLLGGIALERASHHGEPVTLHSTPLSWLQAGGMGACVLDWRNFPRLAFATVDRIVCDDARTAQRLERALTVPQALPEIRVAREASRAA